MKKGPAPKVATVFDCPRCSYSNCVEVKIKRTQLKGELSCRVCGAKHVQALHPLMKEVNVFCNWKDQLEHEEELKRKGQHLGIQGDGIDKLVEDDYGDELGGEIVRFNENKFYARNKVITKPKKRMQKIGGASDSDGDEVDGMPNDEPSDDEIQLFKGTKKMKKTSTLILDEDPVTPVEETKKQEPPTPAVESDYDDGDLF